MLPDTKNKNFLLIFFRSCVKVMNINFRYRCMESGDLIDEEGDSCAAMGAWNDRNGMPPTESMPVVRPHGRGTLRSPQFEGVSR